MRRRGGSLIRATSPGTTRKHRGSPPRSGPRQQNRRGTSTSPCRSLCPSPRHLLHPSPTASPRTGSDTTATAYTNAELPGSDPPARYPRIGTREIRGDAREDAWRDPCIARCVTGLRPSSWYTIGPCGYGVNAGERRSNQRDSLPTWRLQRLAGPADRACIGSSYTQQCVRRGEVAPCRHMATLHAPGIRWSFTGRYLRAGAGLTISRERDRC